MPSRIAFLGGGSDLVVQEDAVRVFDAINEAHGIPAKLTAHDGTEVYVNPGGIAFWEPEEMS